MKKLFYLLFVLIMIPSCKEDPVSTNPYTGSYNITFSGTATGSGTFTIDNNGAWSGSATVHGTTSTMTATVSASGQVTDGKAVENGQQVSTFTGQFSSNTNANGTWLSTEGGNGTWAAVKQ